jgi:hypothetical protein
MVKPISEQLSELSVCAKNAEDHVAAAQKEAHDKVMTRREESRAAAEAAIKKVDQGIKTVGDSVGDKWMALKAKVDADMDSLKTKIAERRHDRDVSRVEKRAETLDLEATLAVDYAIASIEQAELAVVDAILGRVEVERARAS